jgi:NAD(P)-dependent dehydrogenase (short-subunit alcohol dehydrogenase family)
MAPAPVISEVALPDAIIESRITPANTSHSKLFSLNQHTIAITGGGRGLGITLALAVIEAGGNVACLDILPSPAAKEWAALKLCAKRAGLSASYYACDVTDEEQLSRTLSEIAQNAKMQGAPFYGTIACAGVQQKLPALEYPAQDFDRILRINVTGVFLTAKHSAKILKEYGVKGSIVLIASMSGQVANRVCKEIIECRFHYANRQVESYMYRIQLE